MLVVVGAHSRKTGKTSVVCAIIAATRDLDWTAVKISPHDHSTDGAPARDTARYLDAGAVASHFAGKWRPELAGRNTIVESNSVLDDVEPTLFVMVLDYAILDFKESARRHLGRACALVIIDRPGLSPPWPFALPPVPRFVVSPADYRSPGLADLIRAAAYDPKGR